MRFHAIHGILIFALSVIICQCSKQGPLSIPEAKQSHTAYSAGNYFEWGTSIGDDIAGAGRRAMWVTNSIDNDDVYFVRRENNRLALYWWHGDGGIMYGPVMFGPSDCIGVPAACLNGADGNNPYVVTRTGCGTIELWARIEGVWRFMETVCSGVKGGSYGNPAIIYNTVSARLEIVYRERNRIRHWNGRRNPAGKYIWVNTLLPGTGGNGTVVRSDVAIAQNAITGKITVIARRAEGNLRMWYTGGAQWPYRWTTGHAFGYPSSSVDDAPVMCANFDGTLQVLARGKQFETVELAHWEIVYNNATLLLALGADELINPAIASGGPDILYMTVANAVSCRTWVQQGVRTGF